MRRRASRPTQCAMCSATRPSCTSYRSACLTPLGTPRPAGPCGPISLVAGTATVEVAPSVIAANLSFVSEGGALVPVVDSEGITASVGSTALAGLQTPAKDASFNVSSGVPVIVPSVEGGTADLSALGSAISAVLTKPAPRVINVPAKGIDPTFLTAEGRAGHFGLQGMRERAKLLGGKLAVWTAPEAGTEIELTVPATNAYAGSSAPAKSVPCYDEPATGRDVSPGISTSTLRQIVERARPLRWPGRGFLR